MTWAHRHEDGIGRRDDLRPGDSPGHAVRTGEPDAGPHETGESDRICLATEHQAFLQDQLPHGWRLAADLSLDLARRVEFLTWPDRVRILDEFVWQRARKMLSNEEITAVINRLNHSHGGSYAVLEYATTCGAILTSVLMQLKEPRDVQSPHHAMTFLLSRKVEQQQLGTAWVRTAGIDAMQQAMSRLPGYAFLFLTIYPNDSAESFMARDAFWHAMLGG